MGTCVPSLLAKKTCSVTKSSGLNFTSGRAKSVDSPVARS